MTGDLEARLDEVKPDYSLVPDWRTSILITSKFDYRPDAGLAICPRACAHCRMPKGSDATPRVRLVSSFAQHIEPRHSSVAVWDNTLMLTPREHFLRLTRALADHGAPVDVACGLMPGGVAEDELRWRIAALSDGVRLQVARLECNAAGEIDRFRRMLALVRRAGESFAERVQVFAVVNANEPPVVAWERLELLHETGAQVEVVYFTPHNWYEARPFVNTAHGWRAADLRRFHDEWGGFLQNVELLASDGEEDEGEVHLVPDLEKSMAAFARQN